MDDTQYNVHGCNSSITCPTVTSTVKHYDNNNNNNKNKNKNNKDDDDEISYQDDDSKSSYCLKNSFHDSPPPPHDSPLSKVRNITLHFYPSTSSTWNITLLFLFFFIALSLDFLINTTTRKKLILWRNKKTLDSTTSSSSQSSSQSPWIPTTSMEYPLTLIPVSSSSMTLPTTSISLSSSPSSSTIVSKKKNVFIQFIQQEYSTVSSSLSHNNNNKNPKSILVRNMKFVLSTVGIEIIFALGIKFLLMPTIPFTSLVAGLVISTRRIRFISKIKQWILFLPKIARFEKRFKKLTLALKTIQKGGIVNHNNSSSSSSSSNSKKNK